MKITRRIISMQSRAIYSNPTLLIILGIFQLIIYLNIFFIWDLGTNISEYVKLFFLCFLFYFISIIFSSKLDTRRFSLKEFLLIVFIFSAIFRALMVFLEPNLSGDIIRYFWDGGLLNNGVNPYLYRSGSHELDWLRNVSYGYHDFQNTFTIYPPVAQLFFGLIYFISENNFLGMKIAITAIDFLNGVLIVLLFKKIHNRFSLPSAVIYCWSPLLITEFSISGHVDSLTILFLLVSFQFLEKRMFRASTIIYAISCWTKFFPLLLLPVYLTYFKRKSQNLMKTSAIFFSISMIFLLPVFITSGFNLLRQVLWYHTYIIYNPSIFLLIKELSWNLHIDQSMILLMRILFLGIYLTVIGRFFYTRKQKSLPNLLINCVYILGLYFLFAAAVFQWYVSWVLLFCGLIGLNRKTIPWIIFSGTVVLAYLPQFSSKFQSVTITLIEYLPLYVLLFFSINNRRIAISNITRITRPITKYLSLT